MEIIFTDREAAIVISGLCVLFATAVVAYFHVVSDIHQ
jgi:hypothetical protein